MENALVALSNELATAVEQAEFPLTIATPDSDDYKHVTATYQVPAKATQAELQLRLRWAANGEVGWRDTFAGIRNYLASVLEARP